MASTSSNSSSRPSLPPRPPPSRTPTSNLSSGGGAAAATTAAAVAAFATKAEASSPSPPPPTPKTMEATPIPTPTPPPAVAEAAAAVQTPPSTPADEEAVDAAVKSESNTPGVVTGAAVAAAAAATAAAVVKVVTKEEEPAVEEKKEEEEVVETEEKPAPEEEKNADVPPPPPPSATTSSEAAVSSESSEAISPAAHSAAAATKPPPVVEDEPEDEVERLWDIEVPPLALQRLEVEEGSEDPPLNAHEEKAKDVSLHAHKMLKTNANLPQAVKEQQKALDMVIDSSLKPGDVRPSLVAACAFALADMSLAQKNFAQCKSSLAIAAAASKHMDEPSAKMRALSNFAYVMKGTNKVRSAREAYTEAYQLSKDYYGVNSSLTERSKYELAALLAMTGRPQEAADLMIGTAKELVAEAEKIEAGMSEEEKAAAAAGSKKEGEGEGGEDVDEEAERMKAPNQQARMFAINSMSHGAAILEQLGTDEGHEASQDVLNDALELAINSFGERSMQRINVLYAIAQHYRRRGMLQEAANLHEQVIEAMDATIEIYEPEVLKHRINILYDCSRMLSALGNNEEALDYAEGALANAQTLMSVVATGPAAAVAYLEQFYALCAEMRSRNGDEEGSAELQKMILKGRLVAARAAGQGGKKAAAPPKNGGGARRKASATGAATSRAGGRRV